MAYREAPRLSPRRGSRYHVQEGWSKDTSLHCIEAWEKPGQQLNADEVTIISAVLDLKEKAIGSIMTPMEDVFTLSLDDVLDESTMDDILSQGYSRIPVHHPDNDSNFVGMLLVKMLITYDPEDAKPVQRLCIGDASRD